MGQSEERPEPEGTAVRTLLRSPAPSVRLRVWTEDTLTWAADFTGTLGIGVGFVFVPLLF